MGWDSCGAGKDCTPDALITGFISSPAGIFVGVLVVLAVLLALRTAVGFFKQGPEQMK